MLRLLVIVSFFVICTNGQNSCRYEHSTLGAIDLSTVGQRNGLPRFHDLTISKASSYVYSFNPCYSFSEQQCENAAACRVTKDRKKSDVLGIQSRSSWTVDKDGNPMLVYNQTSTTLSVTLICSPNTQDELQIIGEGPVNRFQMILKSPCACWNGCGASRSTFVPTDVPLVTSTKTIQSDSCRYFDSVQGKIDLSKVGKIHGKPRFKNIRDANISSIRWSYNPCFSFSQQNCHGVAACRMDHRVGSSIAIAVQEKTSWLHMNTNGKVQTPSIVYESLLLGHKRLRVELICDNTTSSHHLEVFGEAEPNEYLMKLTSRCACWNGCDSREEFVWEAWMSIASGALLVCSCLCCTMTCCLCCESKPKRRQNLVINEKSPICEKA